MEENDLLSQDPENGAETARKADPEPEDGEELPGALPETAAETADEAAAPEESGEKEEAEEQPEEAEEKPEKSGVADLEERLAALERQNAFLMQREQELAIRDHLSALEKQGEDLRKAFPDFDLKTELADPLFVKLTSPMVGLPVEDAYYALHHREITEAGAQAAAEMLGNSVKNGRAMPVENGTVQRGSPGAAFRPLRELSPEERKLRMDMIRSGKLRFD